jgi:protein-disulfide isomerase
VKQHVVIERLQACVRAIIIGLMFSNSVKGQPYGTINYQGHLSTAGHDVTGAHQFKFAILDEHDVLLWTTGELPLTGSTAPSPGSIGLVVTSGNYAVRLGDTSAGMRPLETRRLESARGSKLRIWIKDEAYGWQQAGRDVALAASARSESASTTAITASQFNDLLRELKDIHGDIHNLMARADNGAAAAGAHQPRPEQETVTVRLTESPFVGRPDAPLVLVEFTDFQCPFCKQFQDTVMDSLTRDFVETGKLRIVTRNLALPFHNQAEPAARAALCANQQRKFRQMRELLFQHSTSLSSNTIAQAAQDTGLDLAAFGACMKGGAVTAALQRDNEDAKAAGITGTPSFVLGRPVNGTVTGLKIVGTRPYANFEAEINRLLTAAR